MIEREDHALAFAMAALAPAVVAGFAFMGFAAVPWSPGGLGSALAIGVIAFFAALFIAGLHVAILAAPLHMLLSRHGEPKPGIVLACATLVGALPIPLLLQGGASAFVIFGGEGLIGGIAFCLVTYRPEAAGEDE
jgi:hypothetical protein